MSILDEVQAEVSTMSADELRAEFEKIVAERKKRQEKQREYNSDPEVKAKRLEYAKQYREKDPEKFAAQRKAYMQRPEVKERMKTYRTNRAEKIKAILARAKELGVTV